MALIKIDFWHTSDIAEIFYQKGFRQRLYLDADMIGKEWPVEKDGSEDGAGIFKLRKGRADKIYSLKFIATEYLIDSLALAQLHDTMFITNDVGETSKVIDFVITQTIQRNNLFLVEATVFCEYYNVLGCGLNMGLAKCFTNTANNVINKILTTNPIYTLPLSNGVHTGDRYIVVNSGGQGKIYQYSTANGWNDTGETFTKAIVLATTPNKYYWYDGNAWREYSEVLNYVDLGSHNFKITGIALPKTFIQLYASTDLGATYFAIGSPTWAETFRFAGIIANLSTHGVNLVKAHCYTHNCDYGYSANLAVIVAP